MTQVEKKNPVLDDSSIEFLKWIEELRKVRNDFDALLEGYELKKNKLVEALQEA